jgi:hypothetical protein
VGYEERRNGPCGGVGPLRSERKSNVRIRRAGCGEAPATPGVIVFTGEKVTVRMTERERESEKGRNDCG